MIFKGKAEEFLRLEKIQNTDCFHPQFEVGKYLSFLWFEQEETVLTIDGKQFTLKKDQVVCLTEFHKVKTTQLCKARLLQFNRSMFCIVDHDSEVGCKGILFFGSSNVPVFTINEDEKQVFYRIWEQMEQEINYDDPFQREVLQLLLQRFMKVGTSIYKKQIGYSDLDGGQLDLIREYNVLVEDYFKTKHHVSDYAAMLHKSPKTLSNLFSKLSEKTPLQYIQDRIILEAHRLLLYSELQVTEIAYELGFEDLQSFGRFFKNKVGIAPSDFRESKIE